MSKYALANDLWIGRLPPPLRNLTPGAKLLLPIARGIVRRFNCKTDSGEWAPKEEKIKAFVGNFVAFPQGLSCLLIYHPNSYYYISELRDYNKDTLLQNLQFD